MPALWDVRYMFAKRVLSCAWLLPIQIQHYSWRAVLTIYSSKQDIEGMNKPFSMQTASRHYQKISLWRGTMS